MNDSITAVPGVLAGHWTGEHTGVTVMLTPQGARAGAVVPGSAPGTRELTAVGPEHLSGAVHGLVLSGGSAFGLGTADGVMRWLSERGHGFPIPGGPVPIVPAAILYDLDKGAFRPGSEQGYAAASSASTAPLPYGAVGAGRGATIGRTSDHPTRGWLGTAAGSRRGHTVGAVVAVNALGSVCDPSTGAWLAGGELSDGPLIGEWRGNTTIAVVATNAPLDRAQAQVLAQMASAALARCIRPAFTPFDGDVVFAVSTGDGPVVSAAELMRLGAEAATVLERAILSGA